MSLPELDLWLPYVTEGIDGIGGILKSRPEDFIVEEIPAFQPIGYGAHIYLSITKKNMTTRETQVKLAKLFGLKKEDVGTAGLKDKLALTTQTFSINLGSKASLMVDEVIEVIKESIPVTVNWARLHPKKLRSGHLKGNKFTITIRFCEGDENYLDKAEKIKSFAERFGIPNYYGIQRIGVRGENVVLGWHIIKGIKKIKNRWLNRFLVSSYLSYLCNRYLTRRVEEGLFTKLIIGDLAQKHDSGGIFWVDDLAAEQPRFDYKEISFTAPIYGYKMRKARKESGFLENTILEENFITLNQLEKLGIRGTRRLGRLVPDIQLRPTESGLRLRFSLPKGGYATTVLREFMKNDRLE